MQTQWWQCEGEEASLERLLSGPGGLECLSQGCLLSYKPVLQAAGFTAQQLVLAVRGGDADADCLQNIMEPPFHRRRLGRWIATGVQKSSDSDVTEAATGFSPLGLPNESSDASYTDKQPKPLEKPPGSNLPQRLEPESGIGLDSMEEIATPGSAALQCEENLVRQLLQSGLGFSREQCERAAAKVKPPCQGAFDLAIELLVGGAIGGGA